MKFILGWLKTEHVNIKILKSGQIEPKSWVLMNKRQK